MEVTNHVRTQFLLMKRLWAQRESLAMSHLAILGDSRTILSKARLVAQNAPMMERKRKDGRRKPNSIRSFTELATRMILMGQPKDWNRSTKCVQY